MINVALAKIDGLIDWLSFRDYNHTIFPFYLFKRKSSVSSQCNLKIALRFLFFFSFFYVFLEWGGNQNCTKKFSVQMHCHFYSLDLPVYTWMAADRNEVTVEQDFPRNVYNYSLKQFLDYNR